MSSKLKMAIALGATCSGCDIAILKLGEELLGILENLDITFWPTATDFKVKDIEEIPLKSIDLCLYHGGVVNEDNEEIAKLLRAKSKIMIAFGACACFGGIPGLANITNAKDLLEKVFMNTITTDNYQGVIPTLTQPGIPSPLPRKFDKVKSLNEVVEVDYYIPGCPPQVDLVRTALSKVLKGELPPKGSIIASEKNLCDECERKREKKRVPTLKRIYEVTPDPELCLLEQGIICMGPATRAGCGAPCIKANMPCRGCMGPPPGVEDQGAKIISAIASVLNPEGENYEKLVEEVVSSKVADTIGLFYMFSLPSSLLKGSIKR